MDAPWRFNTKPDASVKLKEVWSLLDIFGWIQSNSFGTTVKAYQKQSDKILRKQFINRNYNLRWKCLKRAPKR